MPAHISAPAIFCISGNAAVFFKFYGLCGAFSTHQNPTEHSSDSRSRPPNKPLPAFEIADCPTEMQVTPSDYMLGLPRIVSPQVSSRAITIPRDLIYTINAEK